MSGRTLAESLSWPPSKVSKLENGKQTPTDDDIRHWAAVTNSEHAVEALLASLHTLELQHAEWQRQLRNGMKQHQNVVADINAKTDRFRVFETTYVPGLLQTAEYARHRFAEGIAVFSLKNDVDDAVASRLQRQDVLYQADKKFHFILTEAALRYRLCPPDAMLAQLDRLLSVSTLPNVRLGVIGFDTAYVVSPSHGFWLLDNERVMVETFSAELNLAQPQEIALYGEIFKSLAGVASYGRDARAIINSVAEDMAAAEQDF